MANEKEIAKILKESLIIVDELAENDLQSVDYPFDGDW